MQKCILDTSEKVYVVPHLLLCGWYYTLMSLVWPGPEHLLSSLLPVCLSATKLAHHADL